ncbi:MAG: CBS domain-containing protein [Gemmatimonadales bacterium]
MNARDVMKSHPSVVLAEDSIQKAARIMRDRNIGMLPVVANLRGRSLVGVLTDRDIAVRCNAAGHGPDCKVRDHMTRGAIVSVEPDAHARDIAARMEGFHLRRLPVVERGGVVGVVALADITAALAADYGFVSTASNAANTFSDHHSRRSETLASAS